ncbi:MAG: ComEC/Rec2 family competence protein [Clostridia bacterium]|nr:ComEC/Rec2 family competence protein [Clostridia bacterium]
MKRLLALTGLVCLFVLSACFYLGDKVAIGFSVGGILLFLISMIIPTCRRDGTLSVAAVTAIVSATVFLVFTYTAVLPVQTNYSDTYAQVRAVQKSEIYRPYDYYCYELDVVTIDDKPVNTGMIIYSREAIFSEPYDELTFTCDIEPATNGSLMSKGIFLKTYIFDTPQVLVKSPEKKPFLYYVYQLRAELKRALYLELDYEVADFYSAVFLGDRYAIDVEVKDLLRSVGVSHMAVVSGLHLSLIAAMFSKLLKKVIKKSRFLCPILTIIMVIVFTVLTGFGIPVIRSAIMMIILQIGIIINRKSDSLNSLGAAALLLCIQNPYSVGDVGMLLSFCATLGIILWHGRIFSAIMSRLEGLRILGLWVIHKALNVIVTTLTTSLCATIWTLPIAILMFGGFSTVSLVANLLIVPVLFVVLILVLICIVTHYIGFLLFICDLVAFLLTLYYDYVIAVSTLLSGIPFSFAHTDKAYFYYSLAVIFILIAVAVIIRTKTAYQLTVVLSVLILAFGSVSYSFRAQNTLTLRIPDTGKGLSVILQSSAGHAVLCCGGGKTKPYALTDAVDTITPGEADVLVETPGAYSEVYRENLVNKFDYEHVLRYDNDMEFAESEQSSNESSETFFSTEYELYLWNKAVVLLIPCDDVVFEYVYAGDKEVLIIPEDGDCADLNKQFLSPDIVITRDIADNMGLLQCDTLIVPGSDHKASATSVVGASVADRVITGSDILYDIKIHS